MPNAGITTEKKYVASFLRNGYKENTDLDKNLALLIIKACVFGSFEFNKYSVLIVL